MKTIYRVGLCLLLLGAQTTTYAAKKIHDKQILEAYDILVSKPAKKNKGGY